MRVVRVGVCGGGGKGLPSVGKQSRIRYCLNRRNEGRQCEDPSEEERACNAEKKCPDCSRICEFGSLNKVRFNFRFYYRILELQDCTKCTCEDHRVSGKVSDSSGQAISGASIRRKDDFIQTLAFSDFNGEFRLEIFQYLFERFSRIFGICSNGKNSLMASKVGFNPSSGVPVQIDENSSRIELALSKVSLPRLLVNPQSKIRFVGQSARLCCSGTLPAAYTVTVAPQRKTTTADSSRSESFGIKTKSLLKKGSDTIRPQRI